MMVEIQFNLRATFSLVALFYSLSYIDPITRGDRIFFPHFLFRETRGIYVYNKLHQKYTCRRGKGVTKKRWEFYNNIKTL
jgi:hypothetical protein